MNGLFRRCEQDLLELFLVIHNSVFDSKVEVKDGKHPVVIISDNSDRKKSQIILVAVNPHRVQTLVERAPLEFFTVYMKKSSRRIGSFTTCYRLRIQINEDENQLETSAIYFFHIPWRWYLYRFFGRSFFYGRIIGTIVHEIRHEQQWRNPHLNLLSVTNLMVESWKDEFLKDWIQARLASIERFCRRAEMELSNIAGGKKTKIKYRLQNEEDAIIIEKIAANVWRSKKSWQAKIRGVIGILRPD
ncbi:hypothetical protein J7K92_00725 [bacterium]|nr:hypothetical protein [bacterium]